MSALLKPRLVVAKPYRVRVEDHILVFYRRGERKFGYPLAHWSVDGAFRDFEYWARTCQ